MGNEFSIIKSTFNTPNSGGQRLLYNLLTNIFFILCFIFVFLFLGILYNPMIVDEGIWSYMGRVWNRNGLAPYVGAIENKTPGVFYLYALSDNLFGVNIYFVRIIGLVLLLSAGLLLYLICKTLRNKITGVICLYLFGLSMTWGKLFNTFSFQTELPMIFFSILSFYLLVRCKNKGNWYYFIFFAGLSMGIAIAFKQIAVTTSLAALYFILTYTVDGFKRRNQIICIFIFCSGIIIATIFSIIPLFLSGVSFKEYIDGAWLILLNPGSGNFRLYSRYIRFVDVFLKSRFIFFYPILFAFFFQKQLFKENYFKGLCIWLLFDFIGANASGYYSGHQIIQVIPSLVIISALLIGNLLDKNEQIGHNIISISNWVILVIAFVMLPYKEIFSVQQKPFIQAKEIGLWIKDHSNENDYLYTIGYLGFDNVLSYSERVSSSKYFNNLFVTSSHEKEIVFDDLLMKPPKFIFVRQKIDVTKMYGIKVREFIEHNYSIIYPEISGHPASYYYDLGIFYILKRNF